MTGNLSISDATKQVWSFAFPEMLGGGGGVGGVFAVFAYAADRSEETEATGGGPFKLLPSPTWGLPVLTRGSRSLKPAGTHKAIPTHPVARARNSSSMPTFPARHQVLTTPPCHFVSTPTATVPAWAISRAFPETTRIICFLASKCRPAPSFLQPAC